MSNPFSLHDRVVLITGSSQEIGRALADACATAGAHVVINARSVDKVAAAVEELQAAGHQAADQVADVTDEAAVAELGGAAVFLLSDAASFINGQTLFVDGGMTSVV